VSSKFRRNLTMKKQMAISLLSKKGVYLTSQGKAILKAIVNNKKLVATR